MPLPTRENTTFNKWLRSTQTFAVIAIAVLLCTKISAQKNNFTIDQRNNPLKNFSVVTNKESHPFFVDIDGDGDLDCFSGEYANTQLSKIYYYRNDGTNKKPFFKQVS